jgi:hypothetical protein
MKHAKKMPFILLALLQVMHSQMAFSQQTQSTPPNTAQGAVQSAVQAAAQGSAQDAVPADEQSEWQSDGWENDVWDDNNWAENDWAETESNALTFSGFGELAIGNRMQRDMALDTQSTLRDARLQLRADYALSASSLSSKVDVFYDGVKKRWQSQVRELAWQGNLRELLPQSVAGNATWANAFDMKIGRQVLTWGTGDYVFLNDLFPKDYQSFFSGRDDEYLKAPSTALKLSGYFELANMDVVYMPQFEPDIGITGEVFSFYSPQAQQNIAPAFSVVDENRPTNREIALRVYKTVSSIELAAYGYVGYSKQPTAFDMSGRPRYSKMNAYGVSAVAPIGSGIANAEYVFYNSTEDTDGSNPFIPNDQSRFLLGYSQELVANVTAGVQWYTEYTHDAARLDRTVGTLETLQEKYRHWATARLTWMALRQTLNVNGFIFYSPSDNDAYLKATVTYSPTDKWQIRSGINLFGGDNPFTFWGQFEDASNAYVAYRYFY